MSKSRPRPGALANPRGRLTSGPVDKVEYLYQMYKPALPDFPLGAEIVARIPDDLPGELPATLGEYIRIMHARVVRGGGDDR